MEEERKRRLIEQKKENTALWENLTLLQTQSAQVNAAMLAHKRSQKAAKDQREKHIQICARVEKWANLPQDILDQECVDIIRQLQIADRHAAEQARILCS